MINKLANWFRSIRGPVFQNPTKAFMQGLELISSRPKIDLKIPDLAAVRQPLIHGKQLTSSPAGLNILEKVLFSIDSPAKSSLETKIKKILNKQPPMKDNGSIDNPNEIRSVFRNLGIKYDRYPQGSTHVLNERFSDPNAVEALDDLLLRAKENPSLIGLDDFDPEAYNSMIEKFRVLNPTIVERMSSGGFFTPANKAKYHI